MEKLLRRVNDDIEVQKYNDFTQEYLRIIGFKPTENNILTVKNIYKTSDDLLKAILSLDEVCKEHVYRKVKEKPKTKWSDNWFDE
jgi:hypothetical protein